MEQARIEHAPNGSLLTYITSADALVKKTLPIILPAKSRSDVMFCLQSYGTYLSWQDKYTIDL